MNNVGNDFNKTIINNIESELDKTLDASIAVNTEIGATIKVINEQETISEANNITLVENNDNSQTITIKQDAVTYQPQTTFDAEIDATLQMNQQKLPDGIDNDQTIAAENNDATLLMPADGATVSVEQTIVDNTVSDDATLVDTGAIDGSATVADSRGGNTMGASVSLGGGSLSLNVRPRSIAKSFFSADPAAASDSSRIDGASFSDYELLEKLGEGGMGVVYSARQSSIDRSIALKMIKGDVASESAKSKFLIEAVVTGDLDHPNIVPVHDLGVDDTGNIFYAMKQVSGVEWHKVIQEKTKIENIEILLRVCDAIAFSHARGVIHRDLKPENIMLGSFGEVLVMDWGLALAVNDSAKAEGVGPNIGLAGTPAYLAPEMALTGAWKMLGCCSDIYLLGGILFEIITGKRPHTGKNIRECLSNAAKNIIQESEQSGELIDIAYKAMAMNPADRYLSVQDFQKAIRGYLAHSESITLSDKAYVDLEKAQKSANYDDYTKALYGFRQAVELWKDNKAAGVGEIEAAVKYAQIALANGDFDLGLSLVGDAKEYSVIKNELLSAKDKREKHLRRSKFLTNCVVMLGVIILLVSVIATFWIMRERSIAIEQKKEAQRQEQIAITEREEAKKQEQIAVEQREEAKRQEQIAIEKGEEARRQGEIAVREREEARRQEKIAVEQREKAKRQEKIAIEQREKAQTQEKIAIEQREEAKRQEQIAIEKGNEARRQEKIAVKEREEAKRQEKIAVKEREEAKHQEEIAIAERENAKKQEQIAIEKKALAEAETKRANEQTALAKKAKLVADKEKVKAQQSEAKALEAIDGMVKAQTQEQMERAKRKAAELTAEVTQEELSYRDELKKNTWWVFDAAEAIDLQDAAANKYNLPVVQDINLAAGVDMTFRLIPPGKFGMGSREDELGRSSEEYLHMVQLNKPFYIAQTELTRKQWVALTSKKADGEGDYPVWNISYEDIKKDIIGAVQNKLPVGWTVQLPNEAQWEWAARAGTNTPYFTGEGKDAAMEAGITGAELLTSAKAVAAHEANAWGIYDMIGNVAEWCEDAYLRDAYLSDKKIIEDPVVEVSDSKHFVVRGGAWSNLPEHCRAAYRSYANKDSKYNFLGVRLVLIPPVKE